MPLPARLPLPVAAVLVGLGGAPLAASLDFAAATPRCSPAHERIACLSRRLDRSGARVRAALARARKSLKANPTLPEDERPAALAALERTQRAWRAYVRGRCEGEVAVSFTGGTGRNPAILTCLRVHDERRAAELLDLAGMD